MGRDLSVIRWKTEISKDTRPETICTLVRYKRKTLTEENKSSHKNFKYNIVHSHVIRKNTDLLIIR